MPSNPRNSNRKANLAVFYKGLQQERKRLLLGFACMLVTAAAGVALLTLSGWFITASALTGLATAAGVLVLFDIFTPGTGIRVFALLRTIGRYFERIFHHDAVLRVQARWRVALFKTLGAQKPEHFTKLRTGTILQRLTQDLNTLDALYLRLLAPPVIAALMLGLVFTLILLMSWQVAPGLLLVVAVIFPLLWLLAVPVARKLGEQHGRSELQTSARFRQQSIDFYEGFAEIYGAGRLPEYAENLRNIGSQVNQHQHRRLSRMAAVENVILLVLQSLALLILLWGLSAYLAGQLSLPVVVMQALAILALAEVLLPLAEQSSQAGLVDEAAARIEDLQTPLPAEVMSGFALRDIELPIKTGEMTAVIGSSGSGKSSLAQVFAGIREIAGIHVFIEGAGSTGAISLANPTWLNELGYVPQANLVLAGTIATNLRIAAPHADESMLWQALDFAALANEVKAMPEQLETWVGTAGMALSGGQARRLMLARLYLQNTPVVILDEPFTGLDKHTASIVQANLQNWLAGRTCLLLAHSREALPEASSYWQIEGQQLIRL